MSDDIVARLRHVATLEGDCDCIICGTATLAAAEIERLRMIGDSLAGVLRSGSDTAWDAALDAWEDARRG